MQEASTMIATRPELSPSQKRRTIRKAMKQYKYLNNTLYTANVRVGMASRAKNINCMIVGGAGTGKSRGFIIPNLIQMNCNPVITDPKGEILKMTGQLLKDNGYEIRVLDLIHHQKSHGYNPFAYFRNDDDILKFVNNMWDAMEDKEAQKGDPIWPLQAKNLMLSLCYYLYHFAPKEEQNMDMVISMANAISSSDEKKNPDEIAILFESIEDKTDTAYTYYTAWSVAQDATLTSITTTFKSKMAIFNLQSMKNLTYRDEMDLLDLATKKVAIFMVIPDSDKSYNFVAGTLYTQLFQQLYDLADDHFNGPLPRPVRFYMDEFANIALPDDYSKILSTSRSRNISFVIVLQAKQQLEALFEKQYQTIYSNCAYLLFLGSQEYETCEYYSKLLGKETITVINWTKNYGKGGGSSKQKQKVARELMTPDELRGLDDDRCVLYTAKGVVYDFKYDLTKHPLYHKVADSDSDAKYDWGAARYMEDGSVRLMDTYHGPVTRLPTVNGELMDPEEIERMIS